MNELEQIFDKKTTTHEDSRRIIVDILNNDFSARHVSFLDIQKGQRVGGHAHPYRELFYVLDGKITYVFRNIDSGLIVKDTFSAGRSFLIPARIYHQATTLERTKMIGIAEQPYVSPEKNYI